MNQLQHEQYTGKGGIAVGTALCLGHKNAFARFHHCSGLDGGTGGLAYWHRFSGEGGLVHHGFALQYHAVQRYRQHGDAEAQALPHREPLYDPEQNALRFVCRGKEAGTDRKAEAAVSIRHDQPAGCARRRRTDHLYDCSAGASEECRPRSKGAAPSGSVDLMQNLPRISK